MAKLPYRLEDEIIACLLEDHSAVSTRRHAERGDARAAILNFLSFLLSTDHAPTRAIEDVLAKALLAIR